MARVRDRSLTFRHTVYDKIKIITNRKYLQRIFCVVYFKDNKVTFIYLFIYLFRERDCASTHMLLPINIDINNVTYLLLLHQRH